VSYNLAAPLRTEKITLAINDELLKLASQITMKAMGEGNAHWIGNPNAVTEFLDKTAHKLEQLAYEKTKG
jgi:hypothetical protein